MKEETEKSIPTPPVKIYQPPLIFSLGQMSIGNGSCGVGGVFEAFGCNSGTTDIVCGQGTGAADPGGY